MQDQVRDAIRLLMEAIPDADGKKAASELIHQCLSALADFTRLDDTIFEHGLEGLSRSEDPLESALIDASLQEVFSSAFRGTRKVNQLLASGVFAEPDPSDSHADSIVPDSIQFDILNAPASEFPIGPAPGSVAPTSKTLRPTLASLSDLDIDQAFERVSVGDSRIDGAAKFSEFRAQASALGFVLGRETASAEQRIQAAFASTEWDRVLRELDHAREELSEGLFALVTSTFQHFLGDVGSIDRAVLLPGYKTALDQSLLIRAGLANLRKVVASENDWVIQDKDVELDERKESLARLAEELDDFVHGDVFRCMRSADRIELQRFLQKARAADFEEARIACEGLSRYLESLSQINQREVLIEHDQKVLKEIGYLLEAARSVVEMSRSHALSLLRDAIAQARMLEGRSGPLDEHVAEWTEEGEEAWRAPGRLEQMIERLTELAR